MNTSAYACYSLNDIERSISSSGGIYPLLAKEILRHDGVIYAACYNDNIDVVHKRIVDVSELPESQGSKYVNSELGTTFRMIKADVEKNHRVLFVGTPCQCAGLNSFILQSHLNRDHVMIVDFVCHGIPGSKAWNGYKQSIKRRGNDLASLNMRDKSTGWTKGDYAWKEKMTSGEEIITPRRQVSYMKGMLANLYVRPSCFECGFKGINRSSDITLGDYWGVWNHLPEMDDNKGTSLVLIHTGQGQLLFGSIRDKIRIAEADIEKAIAGNACLVNSTNYNPKREEFFKRLNAGEDFISIVDDLTKVSFVSKVKRKMKLVVKKISGVSEGTSK